MTRVIAIDWSGSADERSAAEKIWLADVSDGELVALYNGYTRPEIIAHLKEIATQTPKVTIGFDFSFSVPERFLIDKLGSDCAQDLWADLKDKRYDWLAPNAKGDFWGRVKGHRASEFARDNAFRRTEQQLRSSKSGKLRPKSIFQIGGVGAVGTGSIRGMEYLAALSSWGFRIWPFDDQAEAKPTVIEIYPRFFTQETTNTSPEARRSFIDAQFPQPAGFARSLAVTSEDSFDAVVSALSMASHVNGLRHLPTIRNPTLRREGIIWTPNWADLLPEWNNP